MNKRFLMLVCSCLLFSCNINNSTTGPISSPTDSGNPDSSSFDPSSSQENSSNDDIASSTEYSSDLSSETQDVSSSESSIPAVSSSEEIAPISSSEELIQESSSSAVVEEEMFTYDYKLFDSLPKISITTDDGNNDFATVPDRTNKWDYTSAKISVSNCETEYQLSNVTGGVKVRGNYTANYDKKPFRIKFDKKQKMLGLNNDLKAKSWVLLADVKDSSMLHNAYSFYLGNQLLGQHGLYSSDFTPVSLEINGTYWGMYLLCEQQQVNAGRVDICDVEDLDDDQGNHYTGTDIGYFFEYDGYYSEEGPDGDPTFTISHPNGDYIKIFNNSSSRGAHCEQKGYTIKSTIYADAQKNFIKNYVQNILKLSYDSIISNTYREFDANYQNLVSSTINNSETLIEKYVDIDSLVDMYIMQEISCDADIAWSSFFMSADMSATGNKKLTFQAPWDYDSAYGIKNNVVNNGLGYYAAKSGNPWLCLFMNASWFRDRVKARWKDVVDNGVFQEGFALINDYASTYATDYTANFAKWTNTIGPGHEAGFELSQTVRNYTTHTQVKTYFYNWLHTRLNYLTKEFYKEIDVITGEEITKNN